MKISINPSNTEIVHKTDMENKLIAEVPYTKYNIMGEKLKEDKWKVTLYDRYGHERKVVAKNATEYEFSVIMEHALTPKPRKKTKFKELAQEFINLKQTSLQTIQ